MSLCKYDEYCCYQLLLPTTSNTTTDNRRQIEPYSNCSQVRHYIDELHTKRMSPYEKMECLESIRAQVRAGLATGRKI